MSLLVVMGSGETTPTMLRIHRDIFARTFADGVRRPDDAVMLDTPFAFQLNVDELTRKTKTYFAESVGTPIAVARWRSADAPVLERETTLALLGRARWAFAGPGSPTYALRQWTGTPVPDALAEVVTRGGTLLLGSAAAVTVGTHAIPVYEIYKVGEQPHWVAGLDLLGTLTGIPAVVVPHYNNAEGGGHDTRFCYLGEQRLARLERELPDHTGILGVDEQTALIIDLVARTVQISGNGEVTVRRRVQSTTLPAGTTISIAELANALSGAAAPAARRAVAVEPPGASSGPESLIGAGGALGSLRDVAQTQRAAFDSALAAGDVPAGVAAVLDLEEAIVAWSSDSLQSGDMGDARRVLRALVVRLGELAAIGAQDPRAAVAPMVALLVELRETARVARDFGTSDLIRDRLMTAGISLRDTVAGAEWALADPRAK